MSSLTAAERVKRLLALIPWLEACGPKGASPEELAERFDYPVRTLLDDLASYVNFVTADRYGTYEHLVFDIVVTEDRIWVNRNELLSGPLGVDRSDLAAVVATGRSVVAHLSSSGITEGVEALERAITKLAAGLDNTAEAIQIRIRSPQDSWLELLEEAIGSKRCVELDYYSFARDAQTLRVVEPHRCLYDGFWYLTAHCRRANAQRVFRLDRIRSAVLLDEMFSPPEQTSDSMDGIPVDGSLPEVTLALTPESRWVVDHYPHSRLQVFEDDTVEVSLPVTAQRWLERLMLRLGTNARLVHAPDGTDSAIRQAAKRVLDRYQ